MSLLVNHVWQSTLFAVFCWIAAQLLARHRAAIRYWIWLAASAKFLVPFSVLVGIGAYAGEYTNTRVIPQQWSLSPAVVAPAVSSVERIATYTTVAPELPLKEWASLYRFLFAGWSAGIAIIGFWGILRWRRLSARIGETTPLTRGRERDALSRVQSQYGLSTTVRLASSISSIEPGVRGIFRPTLLLPAGITDRLTDEQLDTILLHELLHIRRRDNLTAAFHVVVQTLFWFHPLVWWIGAQLVNERERSCDEDVLRMGGDSRVYASAILRVCEFYLTVPLAVVSRVTGSNLKTRIEDIMTPRIVLEMSSRQKLLLSGAAVALMTAPVLFGMTSASQSASSAQAVAVPSSESVVRSRPVAVAPQPTTNLQTRPVVAAPATTSVQTARNPVVNTPPEQETRREYLLRVGDVVDIDVWKQPELSRQSVVRPDGRIGIPVVGDVPAEGLTPMQLRNVIQGELKTFITDPVVSVILRETRKAFATIQGSVARPGQYPLEGRTTILDLIAQAGGLSEFSSSSAIALYREETGQIRQYLFNYGAFLKGRNLEQNIVLREGDIIIVP